MRTIGFLAVVMALCVPALGFTRVPASQPTSQTYVWYGQLVSLDQSAKTMTVEARVEERAPTSLSRWIGLAATGN
jgi:hypothetical protein